MKNKIANIETNIPRKLDIVKYIVFGTGAFSTFIILVLSIAKLKYTIIIDMHTNKPKIIMLLNEKV